MKNKSVRHKEFNTFKFIPFSERISNIDVDIFHKVGHEYETQTEENESYFYQAIDKWNVLNLSEGYEAFRKEIRANDYITLPQVLHSKDRIIDVLLKHLKLKNPLCLQPLLEIIVAVAKDLQKEFYQYYPQFLEILIELLNTKDAEQLEWTFTCLAYLFKFLWRSLIKDISNVFNALLPLLSDNKPDYINSFAAESFAFVARKVRDRKAFLTLLLKAVKNNQDGVVGCGKLLFHVINGIDGQFHSSADAILPFLFESLFDEKLPQDILFGVLEQVIGNIVLHIHPQKSQLLWSVLFKIMENLIESYRIKQDEKITISIELMLKLIGQSIEYKGGKLLQDPVPLIQILIKLLNFSEIKESVLLIVAQIGILLLLSKSTKIPQEHASGLIRKIMSLPQKSVLLYFVDKISEYSSFEALVQPSFLRYCIKMNLDVDCFHSLTKLVLKKSPLSESGMKLDDWKKYPLDFKENNLQILNIFTSYITGNNADSLLDNIDYYYCSLVCLPHLNIKENTDIQDILRNNINFFIQKIKDGNDEQLLKKLLFLLNGTVECLIHLSGSKVISIIFNETVDCLLSMAQCPQYIVSLKILSLCLTALKDNKSVITMETLIKINKGLANNFTSPFHEVRLLTSHIYTFFDSLPEFKLRHSTDPEVKAEDWRVFNIMYNVEVTEPHVHTYRDQLQNLERLSFDKPQMLMCHQTDFKTIPLRYLCGTLYINFQLLWEPITKIITSHAKGLELNTFWGIFGEELKNVCGNIRTPKEILVSDFEGSMCDFLIDMFQESQKLRVKPDFINYRLLLWKAMSMFPEVAEAKTRDVSELFLDFMGTEYMNVSSDGALVCSIKKNSIKDVTTDEETNNLEEDLEETQENALKETAKPPVKSRGKATIRTLLYKLNVFSQIRSPMSMYREPELYKLYFDFLQHKDTAIQKAALDCILTYKHKYLTPYKQNLYNLVDDKNFKNEITTFRVDKESNIIVHEHRENLLPIVMQIVFSKMSVKTGLRTGGKASSQLRRNLILRFLAGCEENEMLSFVEKSFKFYSKYLHSDPEILVKSIVDDLDLEKCIPPKRLQSTINLLNVILEQFGGLMGNKLLSYLLDIVLVIGALIKGSFDRYEQIHTGFLPILRNLRTSCIKIISKFFEHFERYPWSNKQINAIFTVFVWPYLNKLNIEGIHSPTTLLKLFSEWGSNPRYFPLLVKHEEGHVDQYVLPHVIQLLLNEKSHITVVNTIEEMLEKMLSLQPDEEDLQLPIPVDNLLPVPQEILAKIGLVDQLNYGSCILLTHVPLILNKIKKKLASKSKNLNQKELFILSRISELVWEADISDTILQLLLPVVLKKCSFSIGEEVVLKYLTTILNLMKNVDKPEIHLKEISPLFAEISFPSCRKILTQVLDVVAEKSSDKNLKIASDLVQELNAWDSRWVDQPDFERRHGAFKKIQELIADDKIESYLGVLLIYNFYFLLKNEKDLSLRENSIYTLKLLCPLLINKYQNVHKQIDYILNDTIFTLIRKGMKSSNNDVRNDCISLLGHLARECPESHFVLRDLHKYTNKSDLEVDFFENLTHLQIHRIARALLKFCQITRQQVTPPNPRTLTQFVLPLASFYLCTEKFSSKNSLIDAAIETIGVVCRILPWHQYEGLLKYYLTRLRHKVEFQKQLVRLTVAILDAFHFDLSKGHPTEDGLKNDHIEMQDIKSKEEKNEVETKKDEESTNGIEDKNRGDKNEGDKNEDDLQIDDVLDDENDEEEVEEEQVEIDEPTKICERVSVLCKSTATRVIKTIQIVLLPQLHKSLAQLTHHDSSHKSNRRKTGSEREEEDLLRVPISLAVVKLLQRLPLQILESNLPGVFLKLCTFLKSQLDSVRRTARETLQKIMSTLGPRYLNLLLAEITPLLSRGFQVHVLVFTIHGVLHSLKELYQPNDIDKVLLSVLNLCTADLFGTLSDEKEVKKITVKVFEAKSTKSYDTLQILAQYITQSCLLDLVLPIKQLLETSHTFKTTHKAQEALRYIALGLVDNSFISAESLLKFAYGTASESIPQLITAKKKTLTEKEREKLRREKEDCLIIPNIPGNRNAYREQNVKTSAQTNAHLLVEFGLRLCFVMLKRDKLRDESYKPFIDPFVIVFKKCLNSKHIKLSTLTLQCLSWTMKHDLPSMREHVKSITKGIFSILHKYASSGLSKGDNFDLVVAAFKAMAVLVRDVKYHTIDTNQLKALLLYVEQDMHDHDRQATAFSLLKAIIARKLIVPEINEVMEKVADLSITSELNHVREQSRIVFHQFLMDYPLGNTLEKHLGFYISQMSYELQYGRESAIEMIQTLINTFPLNVLKNHSGTLLITLGARLVNDEVPECRKMVADALSSMLQKLPKAERDPLFEVVILWLKDKNVSHRQLAAQLCGIFVTVEKSDFESRLPTLSPLLLKQFGLNDSPGRFVKLKNQKESADTEEQQRAKDHHLFQVLQLLLKICAQCPSFLKEKDTVETLAMHVQTLLAYPHDWVRLAAAQFLGFVLSALDIEKLSNLVVTKKSDSGYLYSDPINAIKSLTLDLCDQLQADGIKNDLAEQVVKNLVFVARVLQKVPIKDGGDDKKINLLWLTKRMRKVVNTEVVGNPTSIILRTEVFKWIAGVGMALELDAIMPVLHHLLAPLVREMITTEEKNAPLRQLSKEVANLLKNKIGMEEYTNTLSKLQQTLSVRRAERKRSRTQLAVTDPEMFAKKKIKRHEKKKESKKRKMAEMKGMKRNFKKRKTVELDSSEIL